MPILSLHASRPPVTIANKTPVRFVPPVGAVSESNSVLEEILQRIISIEQELGINSIPQTEEAFQPRYELELAEQKKAVLQRLEMARTAKAEKMKIEEERKKEFVQRMKRGKKKAARNRSKE